MIAGLACALPLAGAASPSLAQGTIFYRAAGTMRAMNANGSNDRLVFGSSMKVSPRDQQTHNASPSCSLLDYRGAPHWLNVLDDDPANVSGGNYYTYGTLYQMTADANGNTTLTQMSDFDFTNRRVGLVYGAAPWADSDTFISFLMADYTGSAPVLKVVPVRGSSPVRGTPQFGGHHTYLWLQFQFGGHHTYLWLQFGGHHTYLWLASVRGTPYLASVRGISVRGTPQFGGHHTYLWLQFGGHHTYLWLACPQC